MSIKFSMIRTALLGASLLAGQAHGAAPFSLDTQPLGYIGPIELSNTTLEEGARAYRGWFENGAWQGDLIEYTVTPNGGMTSSIDLSGLQPTQGGTENWSANVEFAGKTPNWWNTNRKILLGINDDDGNDDGQTAFRWSELNATQKSQVDSSAAADGDTSSDVLDFIRGDRSNEHPDGGFRRRYSILGDIIHSNPEYVGIPNGESEESSYVAFVNDNEDRTPAVYVGANDGMLHAFNAENGEELWAYVPSMVVPNLSRLAGKPYVHAYFVDGGLSARDAYFDSEWRTVLAGSLGSGGKGLFALDVTVPELGSESLDDGNNRKVLWEIDGSDDDMGYIFGESTIAQLPDGKWYVVNGNGFGSVSGVAKLLLIEIKTGNVTEISTGAGTIASPNGLAPPALVDTDGDGDADFAYAGDIDGDLWKFDLKDKNVEYRLYDGLTTQPITVAPDVANHPQTGHLVLFGTGRLFTYADLTDTSVQALYGIHDDGNAPLTTTLQARTLSEDTDFETGPNPETVRTFNTSVNMDWSAYDGWKVELPAGERLITAPVLRAGRLKSTITNPDGYANWLTEATFEQGTYENNTIFDLNRDASLDRDDRVDNNEDGDLRDHEDIPMAWKREVGVMSQVTVARLEQGYDTLFLNYLNPPLVSEADAEQVEGCIGECDGGIVGGHFDVDTDATLGGSTDAHTHEYDDEHNLTYIDYFDIKGDLQKVDDIITDDEKEFVILIANADFSPGATIQIGNNKHNVVEYQKAIQNALIKWNGTGQGNMTLPNSEEKIIHTLESLKEDGGTLRMQFDSRAIIAGGLHPTETGCVKGNDYPESGRYRNGALILHLVDREHFRPGGGPKPDLRSLVDIQDPIDLPEVVYLPFRQVQMKEDLNDNGVIEAGSPNYEVYGGMLASDNDEFLYESTVFWHYDGDCYGQATWKQDLIDINDDMTEELFLEMLEEHGVADLTDLAQAIEELEGCNKKAEKKGGCKEAYESLVALYEIGRLMNEENGGDPEGPATGFENLTGEPVVIEGGVAEGGVTSGPNFDPGRRTWTDVLPE